MAYSVDFRKKVLEIEKKLNYEETAKHFKI